jgi:hypothetical protein
MTKTNLILVITYAYNGIYGRRVEQLATFNDDKIGRGRAGTHFRKQCRENFPAWATLTRAERSDILDDGIFENNTRLVTITHQRQINNIIDFEGH